MQMKCSEWCLEQKQYQQMLARICKCGYLGLFFLRFLRDMQLASIIFTLLVVLLQKLPWCSVVKNLPVNAGDTVTIPDPEDPTCQGVTKLVCHTTEPALQSQGAATRETTAMRSPCSAPRVSPCLPPLEKSPSSNKDPAQPKINSFLKKRRKRKGRS